MVKEEPEARRVNFWGNKNEQSAFKILYKQNQRRK